MSTNSSQDPSTPPAQCPHRSQAPLQPQAPPKLSPNAAMSAFRSVAHFVSKGVIRALKPVKIFAYETEVAPLKNAILSATTFVDFCLIFANVQNDTMLLHEEVYGGSFLFGRGVMVVEHARTARDITLPPLRGNNFMGVSIVASDANMFATNAAILNQSTPARGAARDFLDQNVFNKTWTQDSVEDALAQTLSDWKSNPDMANYLVIRAAVTRVFIKLLRDVDVPVDEATFVTQQYMQRFVESSLFAGYFPAMLDLLGTYKAIREDAYFKLRARGIDLLTIDVTLFAAMFSVGTIVIRCVKLAKDNNLRYQDLSPEKKLNFVYEAVRLQPTVTSVHRKLDDREQVEVAGHRITLGVGDELVYPFVCSNRDEDVFPNAEKLDLNRPTSQRDAVLSWSRGAHVCPAKDLSIFVTIAMLDALSARYDFATLDIFSPEF
ncbi:MAG: hypothetical protein Q8Q09_01920 [Deltaproteobacteria bacterium]|nr:hypothetical protein [Deltaproteobacteria bacterium]